MNTLATALGLIRLMLENGIEAPAEFARKADPARGVPSGLESAAISLARLLNAAGLTPDEAQEAVDRYLLEPNATQFRKPYPDVGMIVARSRRHIAKAEAAATPDDSAEWYRKVMDTRSAAGPEQPKQLHRDLGPPENQRRERALWAGINALGGWRALGNLDTAFHHVHLKTFAPAYLAVLREPPDNVVSLEDRRAGQRRIGDS